MFSGRQKEKLRFWKSLPNPHPLFAVNLLTLQLIRLIAFFFPPASRFFYPPHKTGSSVQFSSSVVFDSLRPYGLQHTRLPCSSPTPRTYSNSCPLSQWCHTAISSSVVPFSFHLQSFPASGSSNQSVLHIRWPKYWSSSSASILPMNIQYWFPLRWTGS